MASCIDVSAIDTPTINFQELASNCAQMNPQELANSTAGESATSPTVFPRSFLPNSDGTHSHRKGQKEGLAKTLGLKSMHEESPTSTIKQETLDELSTSLNHEEGGVNSRSTERSASMSLQHTSQGTENEKLDSMSTKNSCARTSYQSLESKCQELNESVLKTCALKELKEVFTQHAIDDCNITDVMRASKVYSGVSRRRHKAKLQLKRGKENQRKTLHESSEGLVKETSHERDFSLDDEVLDQLDAKEATSEELQLIHYVLGHSEAVYGLVLNLASSLRASLFGITDDRIVREKMCLGAGDFVMKRFKNSALRPAHYIAIDKTISSIVLCVRGTANFADSLTDFAATCKKLVVRQDHSSSEVIEGYGHAGIVQSALNVLKHCQEDLLDSVRKYPNYGLVLTGHSLGGAVAAVLALLLREDERFPVTRAICFGAPPCLSANLAEKCRERVISVVNEHDLVPRLSISILVRFFATCRHVKDQKFWRKALVDLGLQKIGLKWNKLISYTDEYADKYAPANEKNRLYVAGRIFVMNRLKPQIIGAAPGSMSSSFLGSSLGRKVEVCRVVKAEKDELKKAPYGMNLKVLLSHSPLAYRRNINFAMRASGVPRLRKPRRSFVDSIFKIFGTADNTDDDRLDVDRDSPLKKQRSLRDFRIRSLSERWRQKVTNNISPSHVPANDVDALLKSETV